MFYLLIFLPSFFLSASLFASQSFNWQSLPPEMHTEIFYYLALQPDRAQACKDAVNYRNLCKGSNDIYQKAMNNSTNGIKKRLYFVDKDKWISAEKLKNTDSDFIEAIEERQFGADTVRGCRKNCIWEHINLYKIYFEKYLIPQTEHHILKKIIKKNEFFLHCIKFSSGAFFLGLGLDSLEFLCCRKSKVPVFTYLFSGVSIGSLLTAIGLLRRIEWDFDYWLIRHKTHQQLCKENGLIRSHQQILLKNKKFGCHHATGNVLQRYKKFCEKLIIDNITSLSLKLMSNSYGSYLVHFLGFFY